MALRPQEVSLVAGVVPRTVVPIRIVNDSGEILGQADVIYLGERLNAAAANEK